MHPTSREPGRRNFCEVFSQPCSTMDLTQLTREQKAMPRPKKQEHERRRKWAVLNVTPEEREAIVENAEAAGLRVSAYIIRCALDRPPAPRQDWRRIVRQQALLLQRFDQIAAELVRADEVRDAGRALLALREIETEIATWTGGPGVTTNDDSDETR